MMRASGQEAATASIAAPRPGWQRIERAVLGACQGPVTARTRPGGGVEGLPGHGGGGGPGPPAQPLAHNEQKKLPFSRPLPTMHFFTQLFIE